MGQQTNISILRMFCVLVLFGSLIHTIIWWKAASFPFSPIWKNPIIVSDDSPTATLPHFHHEIIQYLNFTDDVQNISAAKNIECGRIWLYNNHALILSVYKITNDTIYIKNINPYKQHCNASRIILYVTVQGQELVGGLATTASTKCEWLYTFRITLSGYYKIMARLLYYDGELDFNYTKCNVVSNSVLYNEQSTIIDSNGIYHDDRHILLRTFGQKFYSEHEQCCEWCARVESCAMYMSHDGHNIDKQNPNRCILLKKTEDMKIISVSEMKHIYPNFIEEGWILGHNRKEITKYYLGSLASTTPTQRDYCHRRNYDLIHNSKQNVYLQRIYTNNTNATFCSYNNIHDFSGRWVTTKKDRKFSSLSSFRVMKCTENDYFCGVPAIFLPYDCSWEYSNIYDTLRDLYNIKRIRKVYFWGDSIIGNMKIMMKTTLKDTLFECDTNITSISYPHLCNPNVQLIEHYLNNDSSRRKMATLVLENNNMVKNGKEEVFVFNLALVHQLWHHTMAEIEAYLHITSEGLNRFFIGEYGADISNWPKRIVFELPFIISEREYHCTTPRSIKINAMIHEILEDKWGWNIFPLQILTEAMQYDFSEFNDGLHPTTFLQVDIIRILFEFIRILN